MTDPESTELDRDRSIQETIPLLVMTALLFVGAAILRWQSPRLGPDNFPLWGLLLTLGVVAAIGSIVSLFFAAEDERDRGTLTQAPTTGAPLPAHPDRNGFGRPPPTSDPRPGPAVLTTGGVSAPAPSDAGVTEPWDEDVLPQVPARGPRPVLTTPDDPGEIGRALEEIEEIQRQLVSRTAPRAAAGDAPARA